MGALRKNLLTQSIVKRDSLVRQFVGLGTLAIAACLMSACPGGVGAGGGPLPNGTVLEATGFPTYTLPPFGRERLEVRLRNQQQPLANQQIAFQLINNTIGGALSQQLVTTDANGLASVDVTAGENLGAFQVTAQAAGTPQVTWQITVSNTAGQTGTLTGIMQIENHFDIQNEFPNEGFGKVINILRRMNDPGAYIVDLLVDELDDNNTLEWALYQAIQAQRTEIEQAFTEFFRQLPFGNKLLNLANNLTNLLTRFRLTTELVASQQQLGPSGNNTALHRLTQLHWTLGDDEHTYEMSQFLRPNERKPETTVNLILGNAGNLAINRHDLEFPFGAMLVAAVHKLAIPALFSGPCTRVTTTECLPAQDKEDGTNTVCTNLAKAEQKPDNFYICYDDGDRGTKDHCAAKDSCVPPDDFNSLFNQWLSCDDAASFLEGQLSIGQGLWKSGCRVLIAFVAGIIDAQLLQIKDRGTGLTLEGTCQISDQNSDSNYDQISNGNWVGELRLDGNAAIFGQDPKSKAVFQGTLQ